MEKFSKTIIIKIVGIVLAGFSIATSTYFYFNTEYKYRAFLVLLFAVGMLIFVLIIKYEGKNE